MRTGENLELRNRQLPTGGNGPKENGDYHAGKWGHVSPPDFYFEIMRRPKSVINR
jgi:hypothetical protein